MQVVCINDNFYKQEWFKNLYYPKIGDVFTVIGIETFDATQYYFFSEFGMRVSYECACFIPLDDEFKVGIRVPKSQGMQIS